MCIAIAKPHNDKIIPDDTLRECHKSNPDGMGLAYAVNGKLSVYHEMDNVEKLITRYKRAERRGANIILHFRIATHGEISPGNAHPYWVTQDLVFAHNGTINQPDMPKGRGPGTISDTRLFNQEVLRPIYRRNPEFLDDPDVERMISDYIGGSKLVFLSRGGEIRIINADKGTWDKGYGAWFSNYGYIPIGGGYNAGQGNRSCGFGVGGRRVDRGKQDEKKATDPKVIPIKDRLKERQEAEDKARREFAETIRERQASTDPMTGEVVPSTTGRGNESTSSMQEILELPLSDEELAEEMVKAKELSEREESYTSDVPSPPHHMLCPCEECETWANENLPQDWEIELEVDQKNHDDIPLGCYTGNAFYCWADLPNQYFTQLDSIISVPRHRPGIDGAVYTCEICGKNLQENDV